MVSRIDELFGSDRASRWRMIGVSAAGVATWGILSELSGKPVREAQINATIFGALVFFVQLLVYCLHVTTSPMRIEGVMNISRRLATATTVAILFAAIPAPMIEAAVLDRRLRKLTRDPTLSPQQADEVGSALSIAADGGIKMPDSTRVQVYRAIKSSGVEMPISAHSQGCPLKSSAIREKSCPLLKWR